ncbi:MAG: hypothetical protein ACLFV5_02775 [Anaerolineales bacterium]
MSEKVEAKTTEVVLVPVLDVSVALVCGVVASNRFVWSGIQLLRIWIAWLVADIVLGLVFAQWRVLKGVNLQEILERERGGSPMLFPYAVSGSPARRLTRAIDGLVSQWEEVVWPRAGRAALTAILGAALALAMATFLGPEMLAIVALGLVFGVGLMVACDERDALSRWLRFLQISLAWILGTRVLGPLTSPTVGLALLMGLGAYAREGFGVGGERGFFRLLRLTNWSFILLLLLSQQPALAVVIVIASLAEAMSCEEEPLRGGRSPLCSVPWFASALTAALAVTRW